MLNQLLRRRLVISILLNHDLITIQTKSSLLKNSFYTITVFLKQSIFSIFQSDEIEKILCHKFMRFMMMRAENFVVLRRKPVEVNLVFSY